MPPFIPSQPSSSTIWHPVTDHDPAVAADLAADLATDAPLEIQQLHPILANPSVSEIVAELRKKQNELAQKRVQFHIQEYWPASVYNDAVWQKNQGELKILCVFAVLK